MICSRRLYILLIGLLVLSGCRGYQTKNEPIHLNPNLDYQAKFKAQTITLTPPVESVPWGNEFSFSFPNNRDSYLKSDKGFYEGKDFTGKYVSKIPVKVTYAFMDRGQERFNIHCAVCHDQAGTGQGMVVKKGFLPPPTFHSKRIIDMADGELFSVISKGVRNMPAYGKQISEIDRWAIVAYVRALQKTKTAEINDLQEELKAKL